ncbi:MULTISPECIES: hypothetical protein [Streptomyces]|uniref:hypothetical protein n=1 Tax=Streptomyces TaxID=1883 RepID=UPI0034DAFCFA
MVLADSDRLRVASSAGEPLTPDVTAWAPDALGTQVRDHFGQTEQGMVIVNAWDPRLLRDVRPGSMGQAQRYEERHVQQHLGQRRVVQHRHGTASAGGLPHVVQELEGDQLRSAHTDGGTEVRPHGWERGEYVEEQRQAIQRPGERQCQVSEAQFAASPVPYGDIGHEQHERGHGHQHGGQDGRLHPRNHERIPLSAATLVGVGTPKWDQYRRRRAMTASSAQMPRFRTRCDRKTAANSRIVALGQK